MISRFYQEAGYAPDMGDEQPALGAGDGAFPVLGQSAASAEPGEGALNHPATGEHLEYRGRIGAFHDLHGPAPDFLQRGLQLRPRIAAVSED